MLLSRRPATTALCFGIVVAALGIVLFVPTTFSDPNGVDPHALRLAVVVALIAVAAMTMPRLRPALPIALALAAVVVPFSLWSLTFQFVDEPFAGLDGGAELLAGLIQLLLTGLVIALVWRQLSTDEKPNLRLTSFNRHALVATVLGLLLLIVVGLAIPAQWLGREGIAPISALAAFGNGLIAADVLQAMAQEIQFRGVLMGVLERTLSPWQANLAQATVFGFGHLALVQYEGPIGALIPITILLGLVFGWITQRTKSLWPVIILHVVAEVAVRILIIPGLYGT